MEIHKIDFWVTFGHVGFIVVAVVFCRGALATAGWALSFWCKAKPPFQLLLFCDFIDCGSAAGSLWVGWVWRTGILFQPVYAVLTICLLHSSDLFFLFQEFVVGPHAKESRSATFWASPISCSPGVGLGMGQGQSPSCIFGVFHCLFW